MNIVMLNVVKQSVVRLNAVVLCVVCLDKN
jgi:hypothetical protein